MPVGRIFLAVVEYLDVAYGSDIVTAEEGGSVLSLRLTIYDTIIDTSLLSIDRLHLFFDFTKPEAVKVTELYIFSNPTNRTIVASKKDDPVFEVTLPRGHFNLEFINSSFGHRYVV